MDNLFLLIDLTNRSYELVEIPEKVIRKYIGGRGLGAYLLSKLVPAKTDPLGEDNHLIFTAGPASGSNLFYSSKANLTTKSPLTGIYLYSIASGILSQNIRKAGFWAIAIKGIADSPTYLMIKDKQVIFKDASSLWGMETAQTQREMLQDLSPKQSATVSIGPAGEQLNRYASVFTEGHLYRCFGRGGAGCVMGSKKLKGIVVHGDDEVNVEHREKVKDINKNIGTMLKKDLKLWAELWRRYETASNLETMNLLGVIPTRNWQKGQFEGWTCIDKSTTPIGWPAKARSCGPYCPTPGCREVEIKSGVYKGSHSDVEWETIYAFGSTCGVDKMEAVIAASQICDEYGIDTMTAGVTIGFAMECFEKGLIEKNDTDGIDLRFGNDRAMIEALEKIVSQEGFGNQLAKGTRMLSEEIKGSESFAMHAKGMEFGGYECRGLNGQALQFAISSRGGCHHGYGLLALEEMKDDTRTDVEGKGEYVKRAAISRIVRDSLVVCTFSPAYSPELVTDVLSALFVEPWTINELNQAGMRVMCQERLFNMREGITRSEDTLPLRLLNEPKPDGPTKGALVPLEELKDDFYEAMDYDLHTGNPSDSLLTKLGIEKKPV